MHKFSVHGALHLFPFLGKIETSPDSNGTENRILGMVLPEYFKIVSCLPAVYGSLQVFRLDSLIFCLTYFPLGQLLTQALTTGSLSLQHHCHIFGS